MTPKDKRSVSFPWESAFAMQVERHRVEAGWTQTELAKRLKERGLSFHQQTVQRLENGERSIRLDEAHVIAELFDVSLDSMLTYYRGPLQEAIAEVDRLRRTAARAEMNVHEDHGEFYAQFDLVAYELEKMMETSGRTPSLEIAWLAAWVLKARQVLSTLESAIERAKDMAVHGPFYVDNDEEWAESGFRASTEWLEDPEHPYWDALPAESKPHALARMSGHDLKERFSELQDG